MKYNKRVYRLVNFWAKLIKRDLFISKSSTGDLKENIDFPLATRVKTVKIILFIINNNIRLSVNNFYFFMFIATEWVTCGC